MLQFPRNSCIQQPKWFLSREDVPPRAKTTRFSTCYIAIFSRKVVPSIAQICYTFRGVCASRNLKRYISGNLCNQDSRAQSTKFSRRFMHSRAQNAAWKFVPPGAQIPHFPRELMHSRAPNAPRNVCFQELMILHFLGNLCLQALAEPTPLPATLPDHWLHSCQSRWPNFGTPTPRILP